MWEGLLYCIASCYKSLIQARELKDVYLAAIQAIVAEMKTVSLLLLVSLASSCLAGVFSPITYPNINDTNMCNETQRQPLYFGLLMSFDAEQFDGSGAIAGVNVALDRINRNCDLLPGYSLHYTVANSRVSRSMCVYLTIALDCVGLCIFSSLCTA